MNEEELNKIICKFMGWYSINGIAFKNKHDSAHIYINKVFLPTKSMDTMMLVLDKLEIKEFGFEYSKISDLFFAEIYLVNDFGTGVHHKFDSDECGARAESLASVCVEVIKELSSYLKENPELKLLQELLKDYNNA